MRVALDGTPLTTPTGGIRRYTAELSVALAEEFPEDDYWLVSDQAFSLPRPAPPNLRQGQGGRAPFSKRWWGWGVAVEMARLGTDVFHGTDFAVPYLPVVPSLLTVHDLSPWANAAWRAEAGRVRRRTPFLIGLRLATMIMTPSESIRKEVIGHFSLPESRVAAVPLAAPRSFRPVPAALRERPYFLYVGMLEARKNIALILDSWREVRRDNAVDLVLVGRSRQGFSAPSPEPGLEVAGEVADPYLPSLYSGAAAFLYPSHYEGFGLPVLEAMACGAAVITSRDPALREVGGEGTLQVDTGSPREWAAAMRLMLCRPDLRSDLAEKALRRAAGFSWARTARATRAVYEEARRRFDR